MSFPSVPASFIGTYVPRHCGIATFTHDLAGAVAGVCGETLGEGRTVRIVAINDQPEGYPYGTEVSFEIRRNQKRDYIEAANFLNVAPVEVVCLQHEFGIFGGADGSHILSLLANLKKPVITTFHTVIKEPSQGQRETLKEVASLSTAVVVMASRAGEMLSDIYGIPREKIRFTHHGVPDVPFVNPSQYKEKFQVEGRPVVLTFGLISPNKGIEYAIDAIADVAKDFPDVAYIVLGATHPEIKRREGEMYRVSLENRVEEQGIEDNVIFFNQYVTLDQLCEFLLACDVYVTPYLSREQIVSGTLAYAIGCGKAIVSTPYWYAEEMVPQAHGRLVDFKDSCALAGEIRSLLADPEELEGVRKASYDFGRSMIWREVARRYVEVMQEAVAKYAPGVRRAEVRRRAVPTLKLPDVNLRHLAILTDQTGILHHAVFATPDRNYGYYTDDQSRALVVAAYNWKLFQDPAVLPLFDAYLSFILHAFKPKAGYFRNHMSYDRKWLDEGNEDCRGRALWALGAAVAYAPNEAVVGLAARLFAQASRHAEEMVSPRACAYTVLGCHEYLRRFSGASDVRRLREVLAYRIWYLFDGNAGGDWPWAEDTLAGESACLAHAIILAGRWLHDDKMLQTGLDALGWLVSVQTDEAGRLNVVGDEGPMTRDGERAEFAQKPLEVAGLIGACQEAFLVTRDQDWYGKLRMCFNWFLGRNVAGEPLYDSTTGGCCDAIQRTGINLNEGAESTIAWLHGLHMMHDVSVSQSLVGTLPFIGANVE
ncbi:MAG: glycosyltransferase family 4 protein [Planctomycetes bacterium]|nr:glycosyltransferase family 4 protein [Planctomycetota bacterium]